MSEKKPTTPMEIHYARQEREERIRTEQAKLATAFSEDCETTILMPLWQKLGDHTPNYHTAMRAVAHFREMDDAVTATLDKPMTNEIRTELMEALGQVLIERAKMNRLLSAKRREMEAANPLPGDNL